LGLGAGWGWGGVGVGFRAGVQGVQGWGSGSVRLAADTFGRGHMNPPWRARTAADVPPAVEEAARMTTLPDMPREGGGG